MIHCSFVEVFFSPPSSGLLILGVEGSVIFEDLDLRLHLTPMVSCLWRILKFRFKEDKEKMRKMGEGDNSFFLLYLGNFFPFVLQTSALFPSKKSCSKSGTFSNFDTC